MLYRRVYYLSIRGDGCSEDSEQIQPRSQVKKRQPDMAAPNN